MILLPLRPASLTHKNPQRRKVIHGRAQTTIERFEDFLLVEYPVRVISVPVV